MEKGRGGARKRAGEAAMAFAPPQENAGKPIQAASGSVEIPVAAKE
jgi:hypothetical protein